MSMPLNRAAFEQVIAEDIAWLEANAPDTLERRHIVACLKEQARLRYEAHPVAPVIADREGGSSP
jgi:hypothetical protein